MGLQRYSLVLALFAIFFIVDRGVSGVSSLYEDDADIGQSLSLEFHHKFSHQVRQWIGRGAEDAWPEKGSVDYYAELFRHDHRLHGRRMSEDGMASFVDGNMTLQLSALGFLHYAFVAVGTPSMRFLVALDTGSDLFWIPCNCISCASVRSSTGVELSTYDPILSSTGKRVSCNSSYCSLEGGCADSSGCGYKVAYVSADTSSSGVLVEDLLYFTRENRNSTIQSVPVVFGCGQVQTGSFLDAAAPDGLLGLGLQKISVPSILSSSLHLPDSFSMCFGHDGVGRLNFGDKGSIDQSTTPFDIDSSRPMYNVSITEVQVGSNLTKIRLSTIFDSGTSFTYFADPVYSILSESFRSQVHDPRHSPDSRIPFEYCYDISSNDNSTVIPNITFTMKSGSKFEVLYPTISFFNSVKVIYCLGIVKSTGLNIIAQNFMTGYQVVFDREKLALGWKASECYATDDLNRLPMKPRPALAPGSVFGPGSYNPEDTTSSNDSSKVSSHAFTIYTLSFEFSLLTVLFILHLAIL